MANTHRARSGNSGVTVDDRAFQVALRQYASRLQINTREDLYRLGLMVQNEARRLAPVDTGRLRASITVKRTPDGVTVGTNVEYAPYVEYGTRHMAAQPYLRPAVLTAMGRWVSVVRS